MKWIANMELDKLPADDELLELDLDFIKFYREKASRILTSLKGMSIQNAKDLLEDCGSYLDWITLR